MGLSQEKVVQELAFYGVEMPRDILSRIENGLRTVYPLELVFLVRVLNIDLSAFKVEEPAAPSSIGRSPIVFPQRQ